MNNEGGVYFQFWDTIWHIGDQKNCVIQKKTKYFFFVSIKFLFFKISSFLLNKLFQMKIKKSEKSKNVWRKMNENERNEKQRNGKFNQNLLQIVWCSIFFSFRFLKETNKKVKKRKTKSEVYHQENTDQFCILFGDNLSWLVTKLMISIFLFFQRKKNEKKFLISN